MAEVGIGTRARDDAWPPDELRPRANKAIKIKSGGTSSLLAHLESKHLVGHKAAVKDSRDTSEGKAKRAMVTSGKGVIGRFEYDTACSCKAIVGCVCLSLSEL